MDTATSLYTSNNTTTSVPSLNWGVSDWTNFIYKTVDMSHLMDKTQYTCCCENKEDKTMSNNAFNTIFGKIAPGMCRISMSGKIAIKTSNGYKAFDWKTGRLTNCDNFAFDIGEDFFFVIPTNKVEPGDIVLVNGKPRCILEVGKNEIKTFCYEDSTISTIVPERHMFMGKNYFYGKIISMFGEMGNAKMMKFLMLKEMMSGNNNANLPMLAMMMGGMGGNNFFDGIFDVEEDENEEKKENG